MVTVCGYVSVVYIKGILFGQSLALTQPLTLSAKPNGSGLSVAWIGHA
jgi:hypothetical protein